MSTIGAGMVQNNRKGFQPGNKLGKGNAVARRAFGLKCVLFRAIDGARFLKVFNKIEAQALTGDMAAAKIYVETLLGKPKYAEDAAPSGQGGINVAVIFGQAPNQIIECNPMDSGQFPAAVRADSIAMALPPADD